MSASAFFSILQYIPDHTRNERVNIALIIQSPDYGYAEMKVRRHIGSVIKCVFPKADGELIRHIVYGISKQFLQYSKRPIFGQNRLVFEGHPTHPKYLEVISDPYSSLFFSMPKPFIVREIESLPAKLEQMFERFVETDKLPEVNKNITKEDLETKIVKDLIERQVYLETKPPIFQGSQWPNRFDALKINQNRRHVSFISFDLQQAPIEQAKNLVYSVNDLRSNGFEYSEDDFVCVLQQPVVNKQLKDDYESSILAFRRANIVVFQNNYEDIARLADGLASETGFRRAS